MITFFDFLTVACFMGLVLVFFRWTSREPRTLIQFTLCGILFAVANQLGNADYGFFASLLIVAAVAYATMIVRGEAA